VVSFGLLESLSMDSIAFPNLRQISIAKSAGSPFTSRSKPSTSGSEKATHSLEHNFYIYEWFKRGNPQILLEVATTLNTGQRFGTCRSLDYPLTRIQDIARRFCSHLQGISGLGGWAGPLERQAARVILS
jgi:hypothetical protein